MRKSGGVGCIYTIVLPQGEMPPESEARPDAEAKSKFLHTLGESLTRADLANREVILRRLNRNEYENTVRDLFGIYVDVKRLLPEDSTEQGFDTTGSALSVSAEQMVLYLEAADLVLDQVFGPSQKPNTISKTVNFTTTGRGFDDSERTLPDGVVLFSGAKFLPMYGSVLAGDGPVSSSHEGPRGTKRTSRGDARAGRKHRSDRGAHDRFLRRAAGPRHDRRIHRPQPGTW